MELTNTEGEGQVSIQTPTLLIPSISSFSMNLLSHKKGVLIMETLKFSPSTD